MMARVSKVLVKAMAVGVAALVLAAPVDADEKVSLALVVSKSSPVSELSSNELKRLYLGEAVTAGGKRLIPLAYPTSSGERVKFEKAVLSMSPDAAARYWVDRKIRGQSGPPKAVPSPEVLQKLVSSLDVAIGYVSQSALSDGLKVVRVDGKLPGEAGYKLEF